jgi:hypothetical protein
MEKKFLINPDSFRAFAYHARGNLSADGTLCQSLAYLIGYKFDDTCISTELVFPRQGLYSNNCKELGMTLVFQRTTQRN